MDTWRQAREDVLAAAVPDDDPAAGLSPTEMARARAIEREIGSLAAFSRDMPLRVQVAAGWSTASAASVQVVGEFGRGDEWAEGAQVDVTLTTPDDETLSSTGALVEAGTRRFDVVLTDPLTPGDYTVRVRARGRAAGSLPTNDVVKISVPDAPHGAGARFFRRGPSTGNKEVSTADLRFRRRERIRIEVPGRAGAVPTATLLDRTGNALAVPVEAGVRDAVDGTWWVTAELALAPLAAGDYVIEILDVGPSDGSTETQQIWTGFRVVR